jgi:lipopolysaccharide/colanic/teichoic acid biosynthesis glycosyltransferase
VARALHRALIRVVNVTVAFSAIVLALPAMALIAAGVHSTSPGPILFRQRRVGRNRRSPRSGIRAVERRNRNLGGELFTLYKFRTMSDRPREGERWAAVDDPRVTPLGRLLRRHHLDELPQLFNVLKGDMNIVGPRPEQPELFTAIRARVLTFGRRQRVLPGITGLAQIRLPYARSVDDSRRKLELDLEYIRNRSVWTDLAIMSRTVPRLLGPPPKGAESASSPRPLPHRLEGARAPSVVVREARPGDRGVRRINSLAGG